MYSDYTPMSFNGNISRMEYLKCNGYDPGCFMDVKISMLLFRHGYTNKVESMESMFRKCSVFDQDINSWDTSSVTNMEAVFYKASSFNKSINDWDVSNVTDMRQMFYAAVSFNQPVK